MKLVDGRLALAVAIAFALAAPLSGDIARAETPPEPVTELTAEQAREARIQKHLLKREEKRVSKEKKQIARAEEKAQAAELRAEEEALKAQQKAETEALAMATMSVDDGEMIAGISNPAQHTVLLLRGQVSVEIDDVEVAIESREGTFLGAISTLTGARRQANLRAKGPTWCCLFNEAELEQLVTCNPAVAVRMIRSLSGRITAGPPRDRP